LASYTPPTVAAVEVDAESSEEATAERTIRVVLIVPAQARYTMSAGGAHQLAGKQIDDLLIFSNCCDRAMKLYHVVEKGSRPVALGLNGLSSSGVGLIKGTYSAIDSCGYVGADHSLEPYLCSPTVMSQAWTALW
jgi:hypothetical protein